MGRKKILVADDDLALLEAIRVRLESANFSVMTTQDAYQALALARQELPDVLVLDINMPAGNGFSVQERIQKIDELSKVPVVYITGEDPQSVDDTAVQLGAFAILHKPFEDDALLDAVRGALGYWARSSSIGSIRR